MLQDYVKWVSGSGWPGCLRPAPALPGPFFPLFSFPTKHIPSQFLIIIIIGEWKVNLHLNLIEKLRKRRGPRAQVPDSKGYKSKIHIYRTEWRVSQRRSPTFLLFSSLPLIANLHRAYAEDDRDNEEQYTTDDARGDRLVLHPRRDRELHLIAGPVVGRRIREHLEIIRPTTDQIFHCTRVVMLTAVKQKKRGREEGRGKNSSFNHSYEILSWDEIRKEGRKRETYPNNWFPRPGSVPCSAFSTARPSCTWWCNIESGDYAPQGPPRWWGNRYWPPSPSDFSEDLASVLTIHIHRLIIMVDEEAELERTSFLS